MNRELLLQCLNKFEKLWDIGIDAEYKVELLPEIRALREELAKPQNEFHPDWDTLQPYHDRIAELEAQIALYKKADNARELGLDYEPEQEPVKKALRLKPHECICGYSVGHPLVPKCICKPEYTAPPKREQDLDVGIDITEHGVQLVIRRGNEIIKSEFYAAPPKQWVGLTDEEIENCFDESCYLKQVNQKYGIKGTLKIHDVARAIEAKLREKNNA